MAEASTQALQDRTRAAAFTWDDVERLWREVQRGGAAGWHAGKAFEHLVVRGFALSGLRVEYPYEVMLVEHALEQIDGMVYLGDVPFLIECKDTQRTEIGALAKLRNQLSRRPPATMGCLFVSGGFTRGATLLSNFSPPHRITLWSGEDVGRAVEARDFAGELRKKYHELCRNGLITPSPQSNTGDAIL